MVSDSTIPRLGRVHIADGVLCGTYLHVRDPRQQRQAQLIEAYNNAAWPDGRVLLKEGEGSLVGPISEFCKLELDDGDAAIEFTRAYGPLLWHESYIRLESRDSLEGERHRGVTGRRGRIVERNIWRLPLREFWREQRRFRATIELAAAAQRAPERLPQLMRQALDILPEIRETFGRELGEADPEKLRANTLEYLEDYERSTPAMRYYALVTRVGELVAERLTRNNPRSVIIFDVERGFQHVPRFNGVLDVLYFLVAAELPAVHFCANCGGLYFTDRPDKRTCGQRCASLFGKREWARKRRRQRSTDSTKPK